MAAKAHGLQIGLRRYSRTYHCRTGSPLSPVPKIYIMHCENPEYQWTRLKSKLSVAWEMKNSPVTWQNGIFDMAGVSFPQY
jgi:hypothetical protein